MYGNIRTKVDSFSAHLLNTIRRVTVPEMVHNYTVEYEGITLRPLAHDDIELLRIWRNDPANSRYLRQIPYIAAEMQEEWYKEYLSDKDTITFSIVENVILGRVVGSISLYHFKEDGKVELGKVLIGDAEAHGKHIGFRAVVAAVKTTVEQLHKNEIYLHVHENNISAIKIYTQAGFKETARNGTELLMEYQG